MQKAEKRITSDAAFKGHGTDSKLAAAQSLQRVGKARATPMVQPFATPGLKAPERIVARALLVGDRIDTVGLECSDMISTTPLALRLGPAKFVALYRFGVAVFVGLTAVEEQSFLDQMTGELSASETARTRKRRRLRFCREYDDRVPPGARSRCRTFPPRAFLWLPRP
jgi:hypothetical protein